MTVIGDPRLNAFVDLTDAKVECIKLTDNGFRKALLRFQKNGIAAEIKFAPAQVCDFADELQEVIDWLGGTDD